MNTVEVRRGNEYLTVPEDAVDRYIAKGYDVLDNKGNVVVESIPYDVATLRGAFVTHKAKIAELEAEVANLKEKLAASSKPQATPVIIDEPKAEIPAEEPVKEAPVKATSRRSKRS